MTARQAALRIAALYGWKPTIDPAQMGTIYEKSAWDVVHSVENIVERYGQDAALYAIATDGADARTPRTESPSTDAQAAGTDARLGERACDCGGEGRCGVCHEGAIERAEALGEHQKERAL